MPVAVHLSPGELALDDAKAGVLRLTVACGPEPASGTIRLEPLAGISFDPPGPLDYRLPPFGHLGWDITVRAAPGTPPGRRFAVAQIRDAAGQLIEDSALLATGQPADSALAGEVEVRLASRALSLRPGQAGAIDVLVRNCAASGLRGEAQLVSPFGSWLQARPWTTQFSAPAGASATLRFDVTMPVTARPGEQWWALVKLMYFGRLRHTEPVEVTVV